jgi:hypothetical protein
MTATLAQASNCISPYIVYFSTVWKPLQFCIVAVSVLLAACFTLSLPETCDMKMPDTIEEVEKFSL